MKLQVVVDQQNVNLLNPTSKLERLPEYFRDTMDWITGRSRRKGEGKENVGTGFPEGSLNKGGSLDVRGPGQPRKSQSAELSVCETISEEEFRKLVFMPAGMDLDEWLATHVVSFFHHVNAVYGAVSEFCTIDTCPVMNTPGHVQCPWVDERGKKCKYSAPQYVDCVMSFIERTLSSEESFPTKYGNSFPPSFDSLIRKVCRLLWHVLGHIHRSHWEQVCACGLRPQVGALVTQFSAFCSEFSLLDSKELLLLVELSKQCRPPSISCSLEDIVLEESQALIQASDEKSEGIDRRENEPVSSPEETNPLQENQNWSGSFGKACAQTA